MDSKGGGMPYQAGEPDRPDPPFLFACALVSNL